MKKIGKEYLEGRCELEIFDIYQNQTEISEDLILTAPTLIRRLQLPLRRVIRDMTKKDKVLHRAQPDPKDLMSAGEGSI